MEKREKALQDTKRQYQRQLDELNLPDDLRQRIEDIFIDYAIQVRTITSKARHGQKLIDYIIENKACIQERLKQVTKYKGADMSVELLEISVRTYNLLKNAELRTLGEIACHPHTLFGSKTYEELKKEMTWSHDYEDLTRFWESLSV